MKSLVMPLRSGNTIFSDAYEQVFSSQISLIPISQASLKNAAQLRDTTNSADAIYAATALNAGSTIFLTNNE